MSEENKKNASERLEDLETSMGQVGQALSSLEGLISDVMGLKEALKLLNNKLDAVVQASNAGEPLSEDNLNKYMAQNKAKELADKVAQLVSSGIFAATDTVKADSFVVINEANKDGEIVNLRAQFQLSALNHEEIRNKLNGAKVGANIPVGDQGNSFNVLEVYDMVPVKTSETAPVEAPAATEVTPAEATPAPAENSAPEAAPAPAAEAPVAETPATA